MVEDPTEVALKGGIRTANRAPLALRWRLFIASTALLVGWFIWVLISAALTAGLEILLSGDGRPGWLSFLVPFLGAPLGWGAGLAAATWLMRRRQRTPRPTLAAGVPFALVTVGSVLVFWLGETRTVPDVNGWWFFAVAVVGICFSAVLGGRTHDASR